MKNQPPLDSVFLSVSGIGWQQRIITFWRSYHSFFLIRLLHLFLIGVAIAAFFLIAIPVGLLFGKLPIFRDTKETERGELFRNYSILRIWRTRILLVHILFGILLGWVFVNLDYFMEPAKALRIQGYCSEHAYAFIALFASGIIVIIFRKILILSYRRYRVHCKVQAMRYAE